MSVKVYTFLFSYNFDVVAALPVPDILDQFALRRIESYRKITAVH